MIPKGAPLALSGPLRPLVADEIFWDHEAYTCMAQWAHLGALGQLFTLGATARFRGPMVFKQASLLSI